MNPHPHNPPWRGEVFYDAECALCARGAERWAGIFERRGFHWLPLQTPQTATRLGVSDTALRAEMKLRFANGRVVGGLDTWVALFRSVWWLRPLGWLLRLPGLSHLGRLTYRWIARNRHCLGGACGIHQHVAHTQRHAVFFELP